MGSAEHATMSIAIAVTATMCLARLGLSFGRAVGAFGAGADERSLARIDLPWTIAALIATLATAASLSGASVG